MGLEIATRVRIIRDCDLDDFGLIKAGEEGTVTAVDPETGETWITLDVHHPGLVEYQNAMWINAAWSADFSDAVEAIGRTDLSVTKATCGHLSPSITTLALRALQGVE